MRFFTSDLPGSGGRVLLDPADFCVDEIPAYAPSNEGEHVFVQIEKTGLTTLEAVRRIALVLGIQPREIGLAGLKDKQAITRQWLSFPRPVKVALPDLSAAQSRELKVLAMSRNQGKLRRGHQKGNRFSITVRDVPAGGLLRAQRILDQLIEKGVPNTFGPQRFGRDQDNATRALAILQKRADRPRDRRLLELLFSALQSAVFNSVLERRMAEEQLGSALLGDVMQKHDTGGLFDVTEPEREQPRADRLEISATAALPGDHFRKAGGAPQRMEDAALDSFGLTPADVGKLGPGTRRVLRYPLKADTSLSALGTSDAYRLDITLPSGAYVTVVLGELIKPSAGQAVRAEAGSDERPIEPD